MARWSTRLHSGARHKAPWYTRPSLHSDHWPDIPKEGAPTHRKAAWRVSILFFCVASCSDSVPTLLARGWVRQLCAAKWELGGSRQHEAKSFPGLFPEPRKPRNRKDAHQELAKRGAVTPGSHQGIQREGFQVDTPGNRAHSMDERPTKRGPDHEELHRRSSKACPMDPTCVSSTTSDAAMEVAAVRMIVSRVAPNIVGPTDTTLLPLPANDQPHQQLTWSAHLLPPPKMPFASRSVSHLADLM